jgi:outer membrane protein assembly factor BamB
MNGTLETKGARPRPRLWPAAVIVAATAGGLAWIWLGSDVMRQRKNVQTILILVVSLGLLAIWACLLSRLARRVRWTCAGAALLAVVAGAALIRVRGVTGDLIPILEFRWSAGGEPERGPSASGAATADPGGGVPIGPHDFPGFLGAGRDAVVRGVRLARDWNATPPRLVWRQAMGPGWSAFAVAGAYAYTQEQSHERELVVCRELGTGTIVWVHEDRARYQSVLAGDGPRATPTVTARHVITMGSTGILNCLDRASGRRLWSHDVVTSNGAALPEWGKSCSPLVDEGRVIVSAGGPGGRSLVAYDLESGERVWAAGDDGASYSSPVLATLEGRRQIVIVNRRSVTAHDPVDGKVLWNHPWPGGNPKVARPLIIGDDRVFISAGYGVGCELLRIRSGAGGRLEVTRMWKTRRLKAKFNNPVHVGDFVYGLDDGILVCLDLADGERRWKAGRFGHGQMLLVEDVILLTTEYGEILLIDPSPEGLRELTRFRAFDTRTWACPALAGNRLLVRSDQEAACYELPLRQ